MNHPILYGLTGWNLLVLGLFVATVAGLVVGRAFTPGVLARGPKREVGWGLIEQGFAVVMSVLFAVQLVCRILVPDASPGAMEIVQTLGFFAMWSGILFFMTRLSRMGQLRLGGVVPRHPLRDLQVAAAAVPIAFILAMGTGLIVALVMMLFSVPLPDHGHVVLESIRNPETPVSQIIMLIISAVVIAPITEEFFFRGFLQTAVQSVIGHDKRWMSILPVSVFFAVIHVGAVPWAMVPVLVLLGAVFGWVYERTGSLWCAVAVHAGFNAASIGLTLWTAV